MLYSFQTDWWALGILAHELLTGRTPWSSLTDKKVIRREIKNCVVAPPLKLSQGAGFFIAKLLQRDPARRLGTASNDELLEAPFFESIDWEATKVGQSAPVSFVNVLTFCYQSGIEFMCACLPLKCTGIYSRRKLCHGSR